MVASLILAPIILFNFEAEWLRLLLMSSMSTVVVIAVTLLTRSTDQKTLSEFYARVQPPGFWRKTAEALNLECDRPLQDLKRGVCMTVTTSLTIYLLLVGCGKLLFPAPGESRLIAVVLLLLGIGSIGIWWRKLWNDGCVPE